MNEFEKSNMARFLHFFFSASGGMGPTATIVYKRLASLLYEKYDQPYCQSIHWLRCFSLLSSAIMRIRGGGGGGQIYGTKYRLFIGRYNRTGMFQGKSRH